MTSLFECCVLLLSCRLYFSSLHDDYPPFWYTRRSIYKAVLPFLINWNEKLGSESNRMTMDHELVFEYSSSDAINTLPNTIIYCKSGKYMNIRLKTFISTGASNRSFYSIFWKRFDHLETLLTIHRPKKVLSAGSLCRPLVPSLSLNAPKGPSYYPKSIMLQLQVCHVNASQKKKTNKFQGPNLVLTPHKVMGQDFYFTP